jgi:hypothetical protein
MLINKGITNGEVVTIKLTSGEEIVARFVEDTPHGYKISRPTTITVTPQGLGLVPFAFTVSSNDDIVIKEHAVITIIATEKQFADQYLQGTTGIKLA